MAQTLVGFLPERFACVGGDVVHLRRLASHEIELHRDVRLRALSEASDFLGEAFGDAAAQPAHYWEDFTRSVTDPWGDVMFLAIEGERVVGSTYGLVKRGLNETGQVRGMWVEPAWRGRGVGRALLQEVFTWARERGLSSLALWAPAHNATAMALYLQAGFRNTGNLAPLATNEFLQLVEMETQL